jgi:hypothetical protein
MIEPKLTAPQWEAPATSSLTETQPQTYLVSVRDPDLNVLNL